ncbi:hypothetical protein JQM64_10920 [Fournierella massiliensis]|nr:hypothetical protein [Fournierella massiliensis]MCF2558021.1 hypothetical protein [Fournierella massiliensis]
MEEEIFAPAPTGEGAESLTGSGGYSAGAENLAGPDGTELEAGGQSLPRESAEAEGRGRELPPQGAGEAEGRGRELPPQGAGEAEGRGRELPPQGGGGLLEALRADKELGELALKVALANLAAKAGPGENSGPSAEVADYGSRLDEIRRLDPSVTGWGDIAAADTDRAYYRLVFEKGLDEVSAYKAVFFDRLLKGRAEAARQQALNEARSKTHLAPVGGGEGRGTEMTAAELEEWAAYGFGPAEARRYKTRFEKER